MYCRHFTLKVYMRMQSSLQGFDYNIFESVLSCKIFVQVIAFCLSLLEYAPRLILSQAQNFKQ